MRTNWPHWPEDQLPLFETEEPVQDARNSDQRITRGGRLKDTPINTGRIACRVCGEHKTPGLPCPHCANLQREGM
jgi:hypothetical protein